MPVIKTFTLKRLTPIGVHAMVAAQLAGNINVPIGTALGMITSSTQNEIQTVALTGSGLGGTFKIGYKGAWTANLAYNASAATVQAALRGLATINGANVTVTLASTTYTVTFNGAMAGINQDLLNADTSLLTGTTPGATVTRTQTGRTQYTLAPYNSGNSDGTQYIHSLASFDCSTDQFGNHYQGLNAVADEQYSGVPNVDVFTMGRFNSADLVGVDSGGLSGRGVLEAGSLTAGTVRLF